MNPTETATTDPKVLARIAKLEKFVDLLLRRVSNLEVDNKKLVSRIKKQESNVDILARRR